MADILKVDEFISKVGKIYEIDYGDFKRKVSQYLMRLEQGLGGKSAPYEVRKIINEIKLQAVYAPKEDVEYTRQQVLNLAQQLKRH